MSDNQRRIAILIGKKSVDGNPLFLDMEIVEQREFTSNSWYWNESMKELKTLFSEAKNREACVVFTEVSMGLASLMYGYKRTGDEPSVGFLISNNQTEYIDWWNYE